MHGLRSVRKYFVTSFAAITLILITASMLAAQTPTVDTASKVPETPTEPKEETTAIKTESEPAKENAAAAPSLPPPVQVVPCPPGTRKIRADVVAIPQPIMLNRLGATIPNGFVFALRSDTVTNNGGIWLRPGKRPRPIVLRANVGDCLQISFQNAIP